MQINTLGYSIKQGAKNLRRNLLFSLASIGTIVACLFLFGIFYSLVLNMEHEIKNIEDSLTISVFFDEGVGEEQIAHIGDEIKAMENVDTTTFISADAAWDTYIEDVFRGDTSYVDSVFGDDNPLANAASYEITLKNIGGQKDTVKLIEGIAGVRKVNSSDATAGGHR